MQNISDLVKAAAGGDKNAFGQLYTLTVKSVYFTALSFVKSESDACDVVQDVYFTVWKKLLDIENPERFFAWLNRITVNTCKNFLLKRGSLPWNEEAFDADAVPDEDLIPEEYVVDADKRRIIMEIIRNCLSDCLYQTVIMFYFNGLTIREIAGIMECPEGTVKYRLNAARARIKKGILGYEEKNDEKLHGIAGAANLTRLFKAHAVSDIALKYDVSAAESSLNDNYSQKNFRNGGKAMTGYVKIIAGAAAVVIAGGAAAAVLLTRNSDTETDSNSGKKISETEDTVINAADEDDYGYDDYYDYDDDYYDDVDGGDYDYGYTDDSDNEADYEEFEGLEPVELCEFTGDYYDLEDDVISGNIKDIYFYGTDTYSETYYIILDDDSNIYSYYNTGSGFEILLLEENAPVSCFDYIGFERDSGGVQRICVIDASTNTLFYKSVNEEDGSAVIDEQTSVPIEFVSEVLPGSEIAAVSFKSRNCDSLYITTSDGSFYSASLAYYNDEHSLPNSQIEDFDSEGVYEKYIEFDILPDGLTVADEKQRCILSADGKLYHHDAGSTLVDEEPLECTADVTVLEIFANDSCYIYENIGCLTDDGRILVVDVDSDRILFESDSPDGEVEEIYCRSSWVTVKTTSGWYYSEIDNVSFEPMDELNAVSDSIVRVYSGWVLLDNGVLYKIERFFKW